MLSIEKCFKQKKRLNAFLKYKAGNQISFQTFLSSMLSAEPQIEIRGLINSLIEQNLATQTTQK